MRNYDKILMTGAQGTGKTTLLKALQNEPEFDNWKFYTNVVRTMVEEEGITINKEGTSESQKKIFDRYTQIMEDAMKQPSISDRCIIDVNAYTSWLFDNCDPKDPEYNNLAEEDFKEKRQIVKRKYEFPLLVYLPITFRLQGDGVRSEDEEYQKEIDRKIKQIVDNYGIPYISVSGSTEERVQQIKDAVFGKKEN